jgi:hypothetical protein
MSATIDKQPLLPDTASAEALVALCEGPKGDDFLARLLATIMERREPDGAYHYLLSRFYELLGGLVAHAVGFRTSAPLFWHEAIFHNFRAQELSEKPFRTLLRGKERLLRHYASTIRFAGGTDKLLQEAARYFETSGEGAVGTLRRSSQALAAFTRVLSAYHDLETQLLRQLDGLKRRPHDSEDINPRVIDELKASIDDRRKSVGTLLRRERTLEGREADYLEAVQWHFVGRAQELLAERLAELDPRRLVNGEMVEAMLASLRETSSESFVRCMALLEDLGRSVASSSLSARLIREKAQHQVDRVVEEFARVRRDDQQRQQRARSSTEKLQFSFPLPGDRGLSEGAAQELLRRLFDQQDLKLSSTAGVVKLGDEYYVLDQTRRYRLRVVEDSSGTRSIHVFDALAERDIFDPEEPRVFAAFGESVFKTTESIHEAIRRTALTGSMTRRRCKDLLDLLGSSRHWERLPGLQELRLKLSNLEEEIQSECESFVRDLRQRNAYAWSLLEMFQVRAQSARSNTLFSGDCRLRMEDPHARGEFFEIGADPTFRSAVRLLFSGSRSPQENREFARKLLRTAAVTAEEQLLRLKREFQYIDPTLTWRVFEQLKSRLQCHQYLAKALLEFVDVLMTDVNVLEPEDLDRADQGLNLLDDARKAERKMVSFRSSLLGSGTLEFLGHYLVGVLHGRRAFLAGRQRSPSRGHSWEEYYETAAGELDRALRDLDLVTDSYLIGSPDDKKVLGSLIQARTANLRGWLLRHRSDASGGEELRGAFVHFLRAEGIYRDLKDYRRATRARARASECEALETLQAEPPGSRKSVERLQATRVLYAACGDSAGFERVRALLSRVSGDDLGERDGLAWWFPAFGTSLMEGQLPLGDLERFYLGVQEDFNEVLSSHGDSREFRDAQDILVSMLKIFARELQRPRMPELRSEKDCQEYLRDLLERYFEVDAEVEAGGRLDLLARGVPIEVKRWQVKPSKNARRDPLIQTARYVLARRRKFGVLVIFDFSEPRLAGGNYSRYLKLHRMPGPDLAGPAEEHILLLEVRIPYFTKSPSER